MNRVDRSVFGGGGGMGSVFGFAGAAVAAGEGGVRDTGAVALSGEPATGADG